MPPEGAQLLVDVDIASRVRAELGPVAWVVLEAMTSSTTSASGEASCSARSLAALVGVSKDAAARALRRLGEHDLAVRIDHRDELTGRFGTTTYRVDLAAAGLAVIDGRAARTSPSKNPSSRSTDQLTLLR